MADFKKLLYDKIVETLNLNSEGLVFDSGYEFVMYKGIPHVIDQSSLNEFAYERTEVIPVSEEYNQETPSVNATDRSDYITQYQIMFRLANVDKVKTALNEFRDYFFTNKQFTLDGYTVGIKTVRGNKQSSMMTEGGNVYGRYKIDVYCTAIKDGYIVKDTDVWKMRKADETTLSGDMVADTTYEIITVGTTDYTLVGASANTVGVEFTATGATPGTGTVEPAYNTLKIVQDTSGMQVNPVFSNATTTGKGYPTIKTAASRLRVAYEGDTWSKHLYSVCMNKETLTQKYDILHVFDGVEFEYEAFISANSRTLVVGGTVIMELDWGEIDA